MGDGNKTCIYNLFIMFRSVPLDSEGFPRDLSWDNVSDATATTMPPGVMRPLEDVW